MNNRPVVAMFLGKIEYNTESLIGFYRNKENPKGERMKALKEALKLDPAKANELGGDLVLMVEKQMLAVMSDRNEEFIEIGLAKMKEEKRKLIGNSRDPILHTLADRAGMCWLRLQDAELQLSSNDVERTIKQRMALERSLATCQSNYFESLKMIQDYRIKKEMTDSYNKKVKAKNRKRKKVVLEVINNKNSSAIPDKQAIETSDKDPNLPSSSDSGQKPLSQDRSEQASE